MAKRPKSRPAKRAKTKPAKGRRPAVSVRKRTAFGLLRKHLGMSADRPFNDLPHDVQPRGLRLAIESERGVPIGALRQHLQQVYGEIELSRVFPNYEPGVDIPSLQDHYFVTVRGLDADNLIVNAFDVGYAALKKGIVKGAEPDIKPLTASILCKDPRAESHANFRWSLEAMNVGTAWDALAAAGKDRGGGIRIGHPDTGIAFHTQMRTQFDFGASFDFTRGTAGAFDPLIERGALNLRGEVAGHGTMTSSVLVALDTSTAQNAMSGLAPEATVVPTRVTRSVVIAPFGHLAEGLNHAWQNSCNIVSVSLGGVAGRPTYAAIRNCYSRGLLICCAAGQCQPFVLFPAILHEAIACGGSRLRSNHNRGGGVSESYWSPCAVGPISIAAPAEMVRVAGAGTTARDLANGITHAGTASDPFNGVNEAEGTSFAAPAVAAIGALWLKFHEGKDLLGMYRHRRPLNDVFREILKNTARQPHGWHQHGWGPGIVDAGAVLREPLPAAGRLHLDVDYLMQYDQGDDLDVWCRRFWDQPRDAVIRVLGRLLQAADEADLRQRLHQFNLELTWLVDRDADQAGAIRQAIQAEAAAAADQVAAAAASLAERASNKLRSMLP
jgi:hypothetical protein